MKDQYQHYLELLKGLRLMDDDFFSEALDEKIEPVEYILRTILERNDIKVQCTEAQVEYNQIGHPGCGYRGPRTGHRGPAGRQGCQRPPGTLPQ